MGREALAAAHREATLEHLDVDLTFGGEAAGTDVHVRLGEADVKPHVPIGAFGLLDVDETRGRPLDRVVEQLVVVLLVPVGQVAERASVDGDPGQRLVKVDDSFTGAHGEIDRPLGAADDRLAHVASSVTDPLPCILGGVADPLTSVLGGVAHSEAGVRQRVGHRGDSIGDDLACVADDIAGIVDEVLSSLDQVVPPVHCLPPRGSGEAMVGVVAQR